MSLIFLQPHFLWAFLLLPLVWLVPGKSRNQRHAALRCAVLAALIASLARPVFFLDQQRPTAVLIVDESLSLGGTDRQSMTHAVTSWIEAQDDEARLVLIHLGEGAQPLDGSAGGRFSDQYRLNSELSPLPQALGLAAQCIPDGAPGAVTLMSDGLTTDPHWALAVTALQSRKIPLHVLKIESGVNDLRLTRVTPASPLRVGHTGWLNARIEGASGPVSLELWDDDKLLAKQEGAQVTPGGSLTLTFEPPTAGFRTWRLLLKADDGRDVYPENNVHEQLVAVQDPLRILYLGERVEKGADALRELLGRGFDITEGQATKVPKKLGATDLVILDDLPAERLSDDWQDALTREVEERGMGLFVSGGKASFGPGGYARTAVDSLLPVECVQKEEKKDPSTTLAIIIDTSGSMVGNRMTIAKQVARLAMRRLQPHDKVGIVEFYGTKQWAAPIQSAANQIDLQRALNRLGAEGGTVLMPAIEEAYYALKNVQTRYKHVLILTDAGVESGPYEALCRRMSDEGMTVSTVLVGPGRHSEFLVELADWGQGRYYNASDRFNLPELLLKRPSTSLLPAYRPESVVLEGHAGRGWWGDVDTRQVPALSGFVETRLRPGAEQLISTRNSSKPVMASWAWGVGRVTAFMSEPLGPGTRSWQSWPGYGAFLGRILARTARGAQESFAWEAERRRLQITVTAERLMSSSPAPRILVGDTPGSLSEVLHPSWKSPDVLQAHLAWPAERPFLALIETGTGTRRLALGPRSDQWPEMRVPAEGAFPMEAAAASTRGQVLSFENLQPSARLSPGTAPQGLFRLWPWCALAALLLYLADVYWRRTGFATGTSS